MKKLKFEFTIDETNMILEALGNLPFNKVFGLVNNIQQQAGTQLNGQQGGISPEMMSAPDASKIQKSE